MTDTYSISYGAQVNWNNLASANITISTDVYVVAAGQGNPANYNVTAPGFVNSTEGTCYSVDITGNVMIEYGEYVTATNGYVGACPTVNASLPIDCGTTYFYKCTMTQVAAPSALSAPKATATPTTTAAPTAATAPVGAPTTSAPKAGGAAAITASLALVAAMIFVSLF